MPTRTVQTKYLNQWCVRRTPLAWTTTAMSSGLSHVMVLVILTLGLGSCAARMHSPADISGLRADLNAHAETLAQIAARVETLERRQSLPGSASGQTPQDLTQAIEVLLKKALLTESRLTALESSTPPPRAPEKSAKQTRHPTPDGKEAVGQQHGDQHGSPRLTQPSPPPPTVASSAAKLM